MSSSIYLKIEVVFHIPKYWGRLPFPKKCSLSSNLGLTPLLYSYLIKFCKFPAISLLVRTAGWPAGWAGGRVLEETKLMLTQPSLVELDLGLSLAILYTNLVCFNSHSYTKDRPPPLKIIFSVCFNMGKVCFFFSFHDLLILQPFPLVPATHFWFRQYIF